MRRRLRDVSSLGRCEGPGRELFLRLSRYYTEPSVSPGDASRGNTARLLLTNHGRLWEATPSGLREVGAVRGGPVPVGVCLLRRTLLSHVLLSVLLLAAPIPTSLNEREVAHRWTRVLSTFPFL